MDEKEKIAEYLAETSQFCICQPKEIPYGWDKFLVAHWWGNLRLKFLNKDGCVKMTRVQCALCGVKIDIAEILIKEVLRYADGV